MNILSGLLGSFNAGGAMPQAGLLGQYYNDSEMKKKMRAQGLLGAGIALLTQKPELGQGIGTSLGAALRGGAEGAQQAQADYMQNALMGYNMDRQAQDDAWQAKTRERQQHAWDDEDQANEARKSFLSALPEDQRKLAAAYPDQFGKLYAEAQMKKAFPDPAESGVYGNLVPMTGPDGAFGYGALGKKGEAIAVPAPGGGQWMNPYDKSFQGAAGKEAGTKQGGAIGDLPGAKVSAENVKTQIDDVLNDPALETITGWNKYLPEALASNDMIRVRSKIQRLGGQAFMEARTMLKGGGQITDFESKRAEAAFSRIESAIASSDVNELKAALLEFKTAVDTGMAKLEATAGRPAGGSSGWSIQEVPE